MIPLSCCWVNQWLKKVRALAWGHTASKYKVYALVQLHSLGWTHLSQTEERLGYIRGWSSCQARSKRPARNSNFPASPWAGRGGRCLHEPLEFSTFLAEKSLASITGPRILNCNPHPSKSSVKPYQVLWQSARSALRPRPVWIHLALLWVLPNTWGLGQHIAALRNFLPYSAVPELLHHKNKFEKNFLLFLMIQNTVFSLNPNLKHSKSKR